MCSSYRSTVCWSALLGSLLSGPACAKQHSFWREHVLGTTMQWTVETEQPSVAESSEVWAVAEVEKLEKVFSRYQPDSELNRLSAFEVQPVQAQALAQPALATTISTDLASVLRWAEDLRNMTSGAFDVRARTWLNYPAEKHSQVVRLQQPPYTLKHVDNKVAQLTVLDWPEEGWTLDAIAKGYIMDRVAELALKQFPELKGVCINIGGDVRIMGQLATQISIENPFHAAEGSKPVASWNHCGSIGIATSGSYRRFENGRSGRKSHLIDARTGRSVDQLASVTVLAPTAMEADGLATAVSVLGIRQGVDLIESRSNCACLIVDSEATHHTSARWTNISGYSLNQVAYGDKTDSEILASTGAKQLVQVSLQKPPGLHVQFELARPTGAAYRRPYLALWLEDADGFPVKTALLWLQSEQPGPRWHRDLTRWYRNDQTRKTTEKTDLIDVISGATRGPGQYEAHFDGTDNEGKPLPKGKYTLYLEVTREHGTHQLIRQPIQWSDSPIAKTSVSGNVEVSAFAFEYLPMKSTTVDSLGEKN